jgi:2-iminobutanoate/2-iminopropanoate deaminase
VELEKKCVMRDAIVGGAVGGPFSPTAVSEGRFVFVAGQGPLHDGISVPGSIEDETRQTLENMGTLLERAGSGLEHVVRCGVSLVDLDDFRGMNGVYETFFPEPRPARATVRADLVVGRVEIDCIACVP